MPAYRTTGPNTRYRIPEAALGAFGIFCTQSPSFVAYQRRRQHTKSQNNAHTLLGVEQMPCDNQLSKLRDPLAPSALDPVFVEVFARLEPPHLLAPLRVLDDPLCVSLDGTHDFASQTIPCHNGLPRQLTNGQTLSYHSAIPPVIVCPGKPQVIALPPEYLMPQDGPAQQDGERAAGKRWLTNPAQQVVPHSVTFLGDDLDSNQPLCALVLQHQSNFIVTCKLDSHPTLSERLALGQATDGMAEHEERCWTGRFTAVTMSRYINDVLLRDGADALSVNWLEITVVQGNTGQPLYHNSWITNHRGSAGSRAEGSMSNVTPQEKTIMDAVTHRYREALARMRERAEVVEELAWWCARYATDPDFQQREETHAIEATDGNVSSLDAHRWSLRDATGRTTLPWDEAPASSGA